MRNGLTFAAVGFATTCFLTGCGESPPSSATPLPTTALESTVAPPGSPNSTLLSNSLGMDLKLIPAGTFTMGDKCSIADVEPTHQVTLTKDFYIGVYEVTQSQYERVVGSNRSKFKGEKNPVEAVSWVQAVAFCEKLSALSAEQAAGRVYRLPTEAEWEYACRAGTTTAYSFGDDDSRLGKHAWFALNREGTPHVVGTKLANPWGLYDMHGNVFEWCLDWYGPYPTDAVSDPQTPQGPQSDIFGVRVYRGGGWGDAASCRTAIRTPGDPEARSDGVGFRVALSLSLESAEAVK